MSKLIKIPLSENSFIYIESCDMRAGDADPMFAPASSSNVLEKSRKYFDDVLNQIREFSSGFSESMKNISDEVEIEFSVKVGADSSIIISSLNTEACITVKLKWQKRGYVSNERE